MALAGGLLSAIFFPEMLRASTGTDFNRLHERFIANGPPANEGLFTEWRGVIERGKGQATPNTLRQVNDFINKQIKFESDLQVWNKNDYWATPMQSLGIQRGDCEDYSIAKYFTLAAAGVPEERMRLMYVQATLSRQYTQAHMVLAYYPSPDAEPLVLDNINPEILPAGSRDDLKPVFSLARRDTTNPNMENSDTQTRLKEAMRQTRMSVWQELIKRAQNEGFD